MTDNRITFIESLDFLVDGSCPSLLFGLDGIFRIIMIAEVVEFTIVGQVGALVEASIH